MARKISSTIISVIIIVTGIIGFSNLNYWERSTWIFKMGENQQSERGFGRRPGNFNRGEFNRREIPDSLQRNFNFEGRQFSERDSTRQRFAEGRPPTGEGNQNFRRGERGGRGGHFNRGASVQLEKVGWFLSVFALFTVFTVYLDKVEKIIREKRGKQLPTKRFEPLNGWCSKLDR